MSSPDREQMTELVRETRLMTSYHALLSHAIAGRVGMHSTDIETMDLLNVLGSMTAGELAARTGLSTGATTRLIDRLERAGLVKRRQDESDRRRVIVEPVQGHPETHHLPISSRVGELYGPLALKLGKLWSGYTRQELATIIDFARRSNEIVREENARIRSESRPASD